jgi:hypothetical protein
MWKFRSKKEEDEIVSSANSKGFIPIDELAVYAYNQTLSLQSQIDAMKIEIKKLKEKFDE